MKKLLMAMTCLPLSLGLTQVFAVTTGCESLTGTTWEGYATLANNTVFKLTMTVGSLTPSGNGNYSLKGTVNGTPIVDGYCQDTVFTGTPPGIKHLNIGSAQVSFQTESFNDNLQPSKMSNLSGMVWQYSPKEGSFNNGYLSKN